MATAATFNLHDDFSRRAVSLAADAVWTPSPQAGVERRMLDRVGGEIARATSVVRYVPGSRFSRHVHGGGEEILVLDGVFSDETGDYPPGSYLRSPPGSSHAPFSVDGCVILVKLWQFTPGDTEQVRLDTRTAPWRPGAAPGLSVMPLHAYEGIETSLVRWAPHTRLPPRAYPGGEEIFVLEGVLRDELGAYPAHSWLRNPPGSEHSLYTEAEGALIYVKIGHIGAPFLTP